MAEVTRRVHETTNGAKTSFKDSHIRSRLGKPRTRYSLGAYYKSRCNEKKAEKYDSKRKILGLENSVMLSNVSKCNDASNITFRSSVDSRIL